MSLITCCQCPQPPGYEPEVDAPLPKYRNKCGCPIAPHTCVSSEKVVTMCGVVDPDDTSIPTTYYKKKVVVSGVDKHIDGPSIKTTTYSWDAVTGTCGNEFEDNGGGKCAGFFNGGTYYKKRKRTGTPAAYVDFDCGDGVTMSGSTVTGSATVEEVGTMTCTNGVSSTSTVATPSGTLTWTHGSGCNRSCADTLGYQTITYSGSGSLGWNGSGWSSTVSYTETGVGCSSSIDDYSTLHSKAVSVGVEWGSYTYEEPITDADTLPTGVTGDGTFYLEPDTEEAAIARATEVSGISCASLYELRTDAVNFKIQTVTFSLELHHLNKGRSYEGCLRLRKRKAYSGTAPAGVVIQWEDVAPSTFGPITLTAANTTEGVTTDASITDATLPGGTNAAIGWEYQITSVHVWPVGECTCPTILGYTDPVV